MIIQQVCQDEPDLWWTKKGLQPRRLANAVYPEQIMSDEAEVYFIPQHFDSSHKSCYIRFHIKRTYASITSFSG